jgi:hypothetical protein
VQHVLTIASSPGAGTEPQDEPLHVVAETDLDGFEDRPLPDRVTGTLFEVPDWLVKDVSSGKSVRVELGGHTYELTKLTRHGAFQLVRDKNAENLVA